MPSLRLRRLADSGFNYRQVALPADPHDIRTLRLGPAGEEVRGGVLEPSGIGEGDQDTSRRDQDRPAGMTSMCARNASAGAILRSSVSKTARFVAAVASR